MAITRINKFQAAEGQCDALHTFFQGLIPYIANSAGCLSCEVLRHDEQSDQFVVIERWESKQAHLDSIANFPKEEMQAAMPLFGAPPSGDYYC